MHDEREKSRAQAFEESEHITRSRLQQVAMQAQAMKKPACFRLKEKQAGLVVH